ncbi:CRISPR-associated helicase/endonuclease Cas3 [Oceanospirillum maris]|uniref:CRISPR-associated helicase/endonuclease Cas3 n=1 Tax=Oceanospirillum maris TaxID=64977 RepID=UPI000684D615|nr:CRISPR-associated helicase/endonuclease Cas3 [Oceanospirillum maris]
MDKLYYRYWGKANSKETSGESFHLLVYHCLDVAACGYMYLSGKNIWVYTLSKQLGLPAEQLRRIFTFFLALHDIGKFSRSFQGIVQGLSQDLVPAIKGMPYDERHDSLGYWLWRDADAFKALFSEELDLDSRKLRRAQQLSVLFEIVTGHHGQPPKNSPVYLSNYFTEDDIEACCQFAQDLFTLWLTSEDRQWLADKENAERIKQASWSLAGLAVLADWSGSDQVYFAYLAKAMPLEKYWAEYALKKAEKACHANPLFTSKINRYDTILQLFPFIIQPTPLQHYTMSVPLADGPQLFLLEDVTGAGKTEAAMVLVHRLLDKGHSNGLYVGLPTMATANAMYERLASCYQSLFSGESLASLVLSHGARHLSEAFTESVQVEKQQSDTNYQQDELSASAYCNAWLADSKKKALLADVGVGTIDQALLSVLPARHQSLRLLGLMGKVLLVDEVHAYDSYMQVLLANLLQMHARQGGSVILLSATLPQSMKEKLVAAYAAGRELAAPDLSSSAYPLATQYPAVTAVQQPLATRPQVARTVQVSHLSEYEEVNRLITDAVAQGQTVCWVRNTVDNVKQSYAKLCEQMPEHAERIHLFHSRFAMCDRQSIEQNVLHWFGKKSDADMRKGRVLVASQVVEQSLDLDFDLMITDLAPVDLLVQRAGRLHRHLRDVAGNPLPDEETDQRDKPVLYLFSPRPDDKADSDWLDDERFRGSAAVYQDLGLLWRSVKVLVDKGQYRMPEDARYLIDSVYSDECMLPTPEKVEEASYAADGKRRAEASMANFNQLDLDAGYSRDSNSAGWSEETRIPTRLSDETCNVVLVVRSADGQWQPYAGDVKFGWDLSTVKIREKLWQEVEKLIPAEIGKELDQFQEHTPALRWVKLCPLEGGLAGCYSKESGWLGV